MSDRTCPICNKPLSKHAHHNAKYCSDACRKAGKSRCDKSRREYFRAHGICVHCGQQKAKPGTSYCQMCLATAKDYTAIRYAKWKDLGLCSLCGKPVSSGMSVCASCLEVQKARQQRVRRERLANGVCTLCGKRKATDGKKTCAMCRSKYYHRAA